MKLSQTSYKKIPSLIDLTADYPSVKALFFDMDGTLFNTEMIHAQAMLMIAKKYKIKPPYSPSEVHDLMMGKADHIVFDLIKNWEGVPSNWRAEDFIAEKNINVVAILKTIDIREYFPLEIKSLISDAKKSGFYLALVTSSEKEVTTELLKLTSMSSMFDLVVTRDDCPRHKPDPWPYLNALGVSGLKGDQVLIFEDSMVGLEAALKSGTHVIKVEWYTNFQVLG